MLKWKKKHKPEEAEHEEDLELYDRDDIDFVGDSKATILTHTHHFTNFFLYVLLAFVIVAIVWASLAQIDEIAIGNGKVIPSSKVKLIQNLEGGIVEKVFVNEGEVVKKGQVLLRLDETRFSSSYKEARAKYLVLLADIVRLTAEVQGKKTVEFPEILQKEAPELVETEKGYFKERQEDLKTTVETLQSSYDLVKQELDIVRPLVKQKVMSQLELLRLEREANDLKGKIGEADEEFRGKAHSELTEDKAELAGVMEIMRAQKDKMERTTIRSPVDGIVKKVNVTTVGEVIKPGSNIMEVVPMEDNLLVEVNVKPSDIAFIHPGAEATVKVTAYDFSIYGGLPAKVEYISADTIEDKQGNEYYKVVVRTNKSYLGEKVDPLPIIPGMTASVNIITGKISVLRYIMKPITRATDAAFKQR